MLCVRLVAGVVRGELDGVTAGARAVGRLWRLARQTSAALLREAAEMLDPLPVAEAAEAEEWPEERWTLAPAAEEVPAPVILPMPSAAQVTTADEAPAVLPLRPAGDDLAALLAEYGSVRAAARALRVAESTLRGRCRKAGVQLPGRMAKR